jgi:hypothetical protein
LRGAEVASTKMVTVGAVADQLEREKKRERQTTPRIFESFIFRAPIRSMNRVNESSSILTGQNFRFYQSSTRQGEQRYIDAPALL